MKRPDWITFPRARVVVPADCIGTADKEAATAVPRGMPATAVNENIEERLMILNELRNKGLITGEEYRAKRCEILKEL